MVINLAITERAHTKARPDFRLGWLIAPVGGLKLTIQLEIKL